MDVLLSVSPYHQVRLAEVYAHMVEKPPAHDYVVRTLATKKINDQPMVQGELVLAGADTLAAYPLARLYPLHFRKTYYPVCFYQDPAGEFAKHTRVSEVIDVPPPIGSTRTSFRSCFLPGRPLDKVSPFGKEPEESNIAPAQELGLAAQMGLWKLLEELYTKLERLHRAGIAHGDAELHNFIVTPAPAGITMIDFEKAVLREEVESEEAWQEACEKDVRELLKEAVYLMCALGRQRGEMGERAWLMMDGHFRDPGRFVREIERRAGPSFG